MRKTLLFHGALAMLLLTSCAPKHYQLTSVERTRIIVDSRLIRILTRLRLSLLLLIKR